MISKYDKERYQRQMLISGFNPSDQERLLKAKVLVVGAGGLGVPVLQCLGSAGVGNIGIVEYDTVALSNLNRQFFYSEENIGEKKINIAAKKLQSINNRCNISTYDLRWDENNAFNIAKNFDIVLDCTDNHQSRITTDEVTQKLNLPWVFGAVNNWEGQVSVFNYKNPSSFDDVFMAKTKASLEKKVTGVISPVSAIIGNIQAAEAIKIIIGNGDVLSGKILYISFVNNQYQVLEL